MDNKINIDPNRLYTKSAYHKQTGISRVTIDKRIEEEILKSIKINGATLIYQ